MYFEVNDDCDKLIVKRFYELTEEYPFTVLNKVIEMINPDLQLLCIKCRKHEDLMSYG